MIKTVFYTDGSGNCEHDKKTRETGNYSVYLVNPKHKFEKFKKIENKITNNQAEIKGIILALTIAINRKYENVEIRTDSKNVICWLLGREINLNTNIEKIKCNFYRTKDKKISDLIDIVLELIDNIPNITINWISRNDNLAHFSKKTRKYQPKIKVLSYPEKELLSTIKNNNKIY